MDPSRLQIPKSDARVVRDTLESLCERNCIDADTRDRVLACIEPIPFDWQGLARYGFLASIVCVLIGLGAVFADEALLVLLAKIFQLSWALKSLGCAVLAAVIFALGLKRRAQFPEKVFSNESVFFVGVLGIAGAVACLGKAIDTGSGHYSLLVLLAALIYGVLGVVFESKLIWTFSLLSLGGWFGPETGYLSAPSAEMRPALKHPDAWARRQCHVRRETLRHVLRTGVKQRTTQRGNKH